jgi:hypothetical protein
MAALLTSNRVLIAFLLGLAMLPLFAAQFTVTIVNYIGLYALVALGLVLLTGIGGLTSFGQAAFVGLGAYATAYLTTRHGMSPWGTLIVGMAITTAFRWRWVSSPCACRATSCRWAPSPGAYRCTSSSATCRRWAVMAASTAFRRWTCSAWSSAPAAPSSM